MGLTDDDVREILRIVDESDVNELRIETDRFALHVLRGSAESADVGVDSARGRSAASTPTPADDAPSDDDFARQPPGSDPGTVVVPSPMLGTFYRAEGPGAAPFVEVGAQIEPDTTIAIIEVMKMMNSVPAGVSGTVVEVCAENGELVEYGEPLIRVKTA